MGTRGWMLPTFMGFCLWILHGLGTAAAVPVTTEGPFAATPSQSEAPTALLLGTVGTSTVNDTMMAESILVSPTMSPSFPSWAEPDSVTETTGYNSSLGAERDAELSTGEVTQAPTGVPQAGTDVATSLDATQKYQSGLAAGRAAAFVVTPQPNFTPSTKQNVTEATAAAPVGSTPAFADVPASTTRAGAGLESTADAMFSPSVTIPTAAGTQAMTTNPLHPRVTALPPDAGAEVKDAILPGDSQGDGRVSSSIPSPGARGLLPTPRGEVVSGTVGDTPGWAALESKGVGDAANGVFSTADPSQLPPENVTALETAENPDQSFLLAGEAGPSPANLLGPGDGDRQGAPAVLTSGPGSALAETEAPAAPGVRGDTAAPLPATDVQSGANIPAPDTGIPLPTGRVDLAESSLQPAPWLSPIGEQSLLGADTPTPTDTSGAPSTAFPPPGVAAGSLPATDDGTEAVVSPDFSTDLGVSLSPPLEGSQPWGTAVDGPDTSLHSALGATNPSSSAPNGAALPAAGQQGQGDTGKGDTTQAEDAGDGSPYENTQSDTSPAASSTQQGLAGTQPGAVLHTELPPAPAPGDGAPAPAVSPNGPAASSHDLSGAGGLGPLPTEALGAPGAVLPPPAAVHGSGFEDSSGTEAAVSSDLGAAPGETASPSLGSSQPWDTAAGAPEDTALPGAQGPGSGINSVLDAPSSATYRPVGPPSPSFGVQPGTDLGIPGADGPDTSLNSALGVTNPSSSAPNGAALPAAGQQGQGDAGKGDTTQAEDAGDGSPYENTQSDTSPAASSTQQGLAGTQPGAVLHTELPPAPAPGDGAPAPAVSSNGPAASSHDLSGAGGLGPLPTEALGAPGAVLPPPAAVHGSGFEDSSGTEAAVSSDLGAAPGETASPSLGSSQPWDTAVDVPEDTALPGAQGPGSGINSVLDAPSSATYRPVGPPSPSFGVQPGTDLGIPGADGPDTSLNSALGVTNPSSSAPNGAALPAAGQQGQGDAGKGDTTQAEDAGNGSPYENTQSDTSPAASSTQQGPTDTPPGAVLHTELPPAPAPGDGAPAPAVSPNGPAASSHDLSGAGGLGPLPIEALGAPGAVLPPPAAVHGAGFEASSGTEAAVSSDLGAAPGETASPSLEGLQPWDTAAGAPEDTALPGAQGPGSGINSVLDAPSSATYGPVGPPSPSFGVQPGTDLGIPGADGPDTSLNSALGATNPSSSAPNGAALPAAGQQAQGDTGKGDTTQAEDAGNGSPYENTQSDTSPAASSTQQGLAGTQPGAVLHTELPPAPAPGDGAPAPAVSPNGPAASSHDLSGAGGLGPLPTEALGAPGAVLPPPAAVHGAGFGPDDGTEAAVSSDLGAAPGETASPSLGSPQPWDTAVDVPEDTALPGAQGPGSGINSVLDAPSSATYGPVGPPSPSFGVQPGTDLGIPGADGPDTSLNSALGATNPSSSAPNGAALPAAGQQAQGDTGKGDTTQAEDAGNGSPYENTQSDTSPAASSTQQGLAGTQPGAVLHTELPPAPAPGDGAPAPAVSPNGPAASSHDLSGAGGLGPLPTEALGAPGAVLPPPAAVHGAGFGPDDGTEAAVSSDLGAAPGETASPSLGSPQPWDTAVDVPEDTALPGAQGPGSGINSVLDAPSSATYGPVGPPSPSFGVQPGTDLGIPGADGPDTSLNSALGVTNPSSSAPNGAALPAAGQQGQGDAGKGDTTQAEDAGDGSPYENTQSDTSPAASSTQQGPTNTQPGAVLHTELPPAPAPGDGAPAPAVSPNGPAASSHDLSGAGGLGPLPTEALGAPGAVLPPPAAVDGAGFEASSGTEAAVSSDLGAAPGEAPLPPSLEGLQPWDTAAGAPEDTALPGAERPGSGFSSALSAPSSASHEPVGPPSPGIGMQPGTGLTVLGEQGQVPGGVSSAAAFEPSLSSSPGTGLAPGTGLLPGANSPSNSVSQSDILAVPSISDSDGAAAPIPAAAPGSAIPSQGSPYGEGGPELTVAQGINSAGGVAQAEIPESQSPYADTSPAASSTQQGPTNTQPGAVLHTELPPAPAPGDGAPAPAVSSNGPAASSHDLSGAGGLGPLPIEALGAPGAVLPPPAAVHGVGFEANNGAEAAVSPDLGAAPEAPVSPSLGESQPWDTSVGAPKDTALPGAQGPGSGFSSVLDIPGSASYGPTGTPSPGIGVQPGTGLTVLGREGQALGGVSSAAAFEPSLSSSPGTGLTAGTNLLPGALSPLGPASPSDVLTAPSTSDTASPSGLEGAGGAPSALHPSLSAAPGLHPAAGGVRDGAESVSADGEATGQSQDQAGTGAAATSDGKLGATLHSASSFPSADGFLSPEATSGADTGAGIPRAGGVGSSSGLGAAALQGNKETPVLPPTTQSSANVRPPGAKLNVVELAGGELGASAQGSPFTSGGNGVGTVIQITSGVLPSSILTSPRETQPLVPVAPAASSPSLVAAAASAKGAGDSSVPNSGPSSASSTQSGSSPPALSWSPVDEMASGLLAPPGEELQRAPNAAPALPSTSERENLKEGAAASPQLSSPVSATPGQPAAAPNPPPLPPVPAVPLYGYGPRENDHEYVQRRADFNSPLFKPETGFPFGKTLRDSLYFTDNGQIIFPASDSSILTLPNPPARGFTGREGVPMIAVFWDNADFSRGTGTTFYQEFLTLNSEKPPFVRDVEVKVRRYLRSSYSAAWTLKITWEKAPAYGARGDSRRTNTYQAVLTTDGFRSYVLILYQDGGMQWDYTQLPATNVLIGYTSGDGYYRNDDLTQGSPAAKYRPDRYRGYNTDLRGLWLYKLESRVGINYRLKCLAWTGRQQEPQAWSQDLPACPCSLQQGQQDLRFRSSRGGWGSARVSMLHSASPNSHGAGVRCLYDGRGQLVEGRQERYWRASRQASPYRDQELKLYDWCCNQAGSARLCALYNEKRPRIGCEGYQAPTAEDSSEDSDSEEQRDDEEE